MNSARRENTLSQSEPIFTSVRPVNRVEWRKTRGGEKERRGEEQKEEERRGESSRPLNSGGKCILREKSTYSSASSFAWCRRMLFFLCVRVANAQSVIEISARH